MLDDVPGSFVWLPRAGETMNCIQFRGEEILPLIVVNYVFSGRVARRSGLEERRRRRRRDRGKRVKMSQKRANHPRRGIKSRYVLRERENSFCTKKIKRY